jgi:hypothetical protein
MEDVLETYTLPCNPKRPVICLDETSRQLIGESRNPLPAEPGKTAVCDYEYVRNGAADLFMMLEPLKGHREVTVTERRTKKDFARCLQELAEQHYSDAEKIILVMDNLNTHSLASLYEAFPPVTARSIAERFEIHHTPKHGSRLNRAELEIGIVNRQCLNRRIPALEEMRSVVRARAAERNNQHTMVHWQFTTRDARIKLQHLYPKIEAL